MQQAQLTVPNPWHVLNVDRELPTCLQGVGITHALGRGGDGSETSSRIVGVSPTGLWEWHPLSGHQSHPRFIGRGVIDYLFAVSTSTDTNTNED
jgi:hypothetical protein